MEWEKLSSTPAYTGRRKIDSVTYKFPNGVVADFEIKREGKTICIFGLTEQNTVLLAKQFRPGPGKVLLELPGGAVDADEDILEAAKREFLEETGYTSDDVEIVGTSFLDAYSTRVAYSAVAKNCRKIQEVKDDPNEPIELVEMSLEDFRKHLRSGMLTDMATGYLCLDHLGLL